MKSKDLHTQGHIHANFGAKIFRLASLAQDGNAIVGKINSGEVCCFVVCLS